MLFTGEELAIKYADSGVEAPLCAVWVYYVISKNAEAADRIWKQYVSSFSGIHYRPVIKHAFDNKDDAVVLNLIKYLKSSENSAKYEKGAYNALLDLYTNKGEVDKSLQLINEKSIDFFNNAALLRLKAAVEGAGKKFPYEIKQNVADKDDQKSN